MFIRDKINEIIDNNGYISIDDFIKETLSNNKDSYYKKLTSIGKDGDFTTAPEISQIFGEIIGLWAVEQCFILKNDSRKIIILELGPGSGALILNILKIFKLVPELFSILEIYLLEINPHFIKAQKKTLQNQKIPIYWISNLNELPQNKIIITLANEFFDALPIKQFIKKKNTWKEIVITRNPHLQQLKFTEISIDTTLNNFLLKEYPEAQEEAIIEESKDSISLLQNLLNLFKKSKAAAMLIIDYGYDIVKRNSTQFNPTLQAVFNHKFANLLENLGQYDITSHVNFQDLKKTLMSNKTDTMEIFSQREFLIKYGIMLRLEKLKIQNPDLKKILEKQVNRLISKNQMGELFKILEFKILNNKNI
ncbi:MAG: SAM-dependent methyltransferase [Rickettsia sp.]|nr:SAM-dependent methyltransferase [Rickettsia sp.]